MIEASREDLGGNLIFFFYKTFYFWTAAYVSPLTISYNNFLVCLRFLVRCIIFYIF
jgi:hypothetical protein